MSEPLTTTQKIEQIITQARAEGWTRKETRDRIFKMNDAELWAERDQVLAALGFATTEQMVAQQAQEEAAKQAFEREQREAREQARAESARLAAQAEREQKEAKERAARKAMDEIAAIEPHWPTYKKVLALIRDCNELADAMRHHDVGDIIAFKRAPEELGELAELVGLTRDFAAADVLDKAGRFELSEKQSKLVALTLAKLAAKSGMTGKKPVGFDSAQELATLENDEIAVAIDRGSPQRLSVCVVSTKKGGVRPYLAVLGPTWKDRAFVKKQKFTNTSVRFHAADLPVGTVLEWRAANWDGESHTGGVTHALVVAGGLLVITAKKARELLDGEPANAVMIDRFTECRRVWDEAFPGLEEYQGAELWLPGKAVCDDDETHD